MLKESDVGVLPEMVCIDTAHDINSAPSTTPIEGNKLPLINQGMHQLF